MKNRLLRILLVAAVLSTILWLAEKTQHRETTLPSPSPAGTPATPPPAPSLPAPSPDAPPKPPAPAPPIPPPSPDQRRDPSPAPPPLKRDFENPLAPSSVPPDTVPRSADENPSASAEFGKIIIMLRDYRTIAGENPVGTNAEIMKALMGDNPKNAVLGPPEGMSLNAEGELLDAWGTPYFFHQISRDVMEIISAGPDKRRGTEDDLIAR